MEKSIEMRVAELEKQVFHTKNVLSFEEASRFFEPLEKLPLQTDVGQSDSALQAAGQDALFRAGGIGGMVASQSRQDAGTD